VTSKQKYSDVVQAIRSVPHQLPEIREQNDLTLSYIESGGFVLEDCKYTSILHSQIRNLLVSTRQLGLALVDVTLENTLFRASIKHSYLDRCYITYSTIGACVLYRTHMFYNAIYDCRVNNTTFSCCTLLGNSFSAVVFEDVQFKGCSFHENTIKDCLFVNCKFVDCDTFGNVLEHNTFYNCEGHECLTRKEQ